MDLLNIDAEQEEFLVKNATIVFDTSSIGQLYYLTEDSKKTMVDILYCLKIGFGCQPKYFWNIARIVRSC